MSVEQRDPIVGLLTTDRQALLHGSHLHLDIVHLFCCHALHFCCTAFALPGGVGLARRAKERHCRSSRLAPPVRHNHRRPSKTDLAGADLPPPLLFFALACSAVHRTALHRIASHRIA